ncbi:MAG TPA: Gfo/Idh/MocA family oxidoreductase, partial [Cytophagaceae bacterium]|nr:Gfo/Idh/MocA family oxidoreductase [Cytophagaceae bacterium]
IAHKFAEAIGNVQNAELYAVASRNENLARVFAAQYKASFFYGNYEAMVCNPNLDIVYIATPHAFHKEHTLLCLNHKKAVLCEKPLAHKYEDVKSMIQTASDNQVLLIEAMWSRFLPPINKALQLINEDEIGEVEKITADFGFKSIYDAKSRLYDKMLGGGSLLDVGVYPLFLALVVLGEPLGCNASAVLTETGVDEECYFHLQYANATAALMSSIVKDTKREAVILGKKGSIRFVSPWYRQTTLILEKQNGTMKEFHFDYSGNGFEYQIREAMKCLEQGKIESELMPHHFSLLQSKILDTICKQCAIVYP